MGLPKGNWAKRLYNQEVSKQVDEMMKNPTYLEKMKEWRKEDTVNAMVRLCFITLTYLETKHRYKKNGLESFIKWMKDDVEKQIPNDVGYLNACKKYYKEELGIDVYEMHGVEVIDK